MNGKQNPKKGPMKTMANTKQPGKLKQKYLKSKFHKEIVQLRTEMKPMTWKQRVDHIWTYYKEYIGLVALFLFISIGLITSMVNARKPTVITGMLVNVGMDQVGYNYLSEDYAEYLKLGDNSKIKMEATSFHDLETNASEENYYAAMTVVAEVSAKKLDYMILDEMGMKFYAGQEVYLDLTNIFTEAELKEFAEKDLLIYCMEEEEKKPWPAAVKISDLPFIQEYVTTEGEVFFAGSGSSAKYEEIRQLWDYMNAWEAKK